MQTYITNNKPTFLTFVMPLTGLFHNTNILHSHCLLFSSCAVDQFSNWYVSLQRRPSLFRRLVGALRSGNSNSDDEEAEIDTSSDYLTTTRRRSKTLTSLPTMWVMLLLNWTHDRDGSKCSIFSSLRSKNPFSVVGAYGMFLLANMLAVFTLKFFTGASRNIFTPLRIHSI